MERRERGRGVERGGGKSVGKERGAESTRLRGREGKA